MHNLLNDNEKQLSKFAEYLLRNKLVPEHHAKYFVLWVRRFLEKGVQDGSLSLTERMDQYLLGLQTEQHYAEWQLLQAERAIRLYFHNFQQDTDWTATPEKDRGEGTPAPTEGADCFWSRPACPEFYRRALRPD
jgi:hypothetical protein